MLTSLSPPWSAVLPTPVTWQVGAVETRSDSRNCVAGGQKSRGPSPRAGSQPGCGGTRVGHSRGTASLGSVRRQRRAPRQPRAQGSEEGSGSRGRVAAGRQPRCDPAPSPMWARRPPAGAAARGVRAPGRRALRLLLPLLLLLAAAPSGRAGRRVRDGDVTGPGPPTAERRPGPSARGCRVHARAAGGAGVGARSPGRNSPPPRARLLRRQVCRTESFTLPVAGGAVRWRKCDSGGSEWNPQLGT